MCCCVMVLWYIVVVCCCGMLWYAVVCCVLLCFGVVVWWFVVVYCGLLWFVVLWVCAMVFHVFGWGWKTGGRKGGGEGGEGAVFFEGRAHPALLCGTHRPSTTQDPPTSLTTKYKTEIPPENIHQDLQNSFRVLATYADTDLLKEVADEPDQFLHMSTCSLHNVR